MYPAAPLAGSLGAIWAGRGRRARFFPAPLGGLARAIEGLPRTEHPGAGSTAGRVDAWIAVDCACGIAPPDRRRREGNDGRSAGGGGADEACLAGPAAATRSCRRGEAAPLFDPLVRRDVSSAASRPSRTSMLSERPPETRRSLARSDGSRSHRSRSASQPPPFKQSCSSGAATASGRCRPSGFGMNRRRAGSA